MNEGISGRVHWAQLYGRSPRRDATTLSDAKGMGRLRRIASVVARPSKSKTKSAIENITPDGSSLFDLPKSQRLYFQVGIDVQHVALALHTHL